MRNLCYTHIISNRRANSNTVIYNYFLILRG